MKTPQYILEPYKGMRTRHTCPGCQQRDKTFAQYIDAKTGEPLHPSVGRCNRESKCGYHYTPKQYFQDNPTGQSQLKPYKPLMPAPAPKPVSFIPDGIFKASLKAYEKNHFIQYLISLFGMDTAGELIRKYFIGSSNNWEGATVFWQIDRTGKIRTGKIMLYSPTTGKRVKEPYNHINWVHKVIKQPEFGLSQCLFGEHLLRDKTKPVAIVESEKTAIIASVYFPQFVWVAFGGIGFNLDKCQSLTGRKVILFPDLKGYDKWNTKAKELSHLARFQISDLLERKATEAEKGEGLDLADYLIRFDFRDFQKPLPVPTAPEISERAKPIIPDKPEPTDWGKVRKDLTGFFAGLPIPEHPIQLDKCTTIQDFPTFIKTHLNQLRDTPQPERIEQIFLDRLIQAKQVICQNVQYEKAV
jgi:hypothetical protein